jgi:hypothetical protein
MNEQHKHRSHGRSVGARYALVSARQKRSSAAWVLMLMIGPKTAVAIFGPEEPGVPKPDLKRSRCVSSVFFQGHRAKAPVTVLVN